MWRELKKMAAGRDQISYWAFVNADSYEETVYRAYITSFLVTYGYSAMSVNPLEEEVFLIPNEERMETGTNSNSVSIPIPIDYETWKSFRGKKLE